MSPLSKYLLGNEIAGNTRTNIIWKEFPFIACNFFTHNRARAWCSTIGVPYYRFNPQLSEDIAMDEKDDQKLINMLWHTKAYMHTNRNKIIEMINFLK